MTVDLDQLAAAAGIIPEFVDARGQRVVASEQVKRELLRRMRTAPAARSCSEPSPPNLVPRTFVVVPAANGEAQLNLPSQLKGQTLHWRVTCEDGKTEEGRGACTAGTKENCCCLTIRPVPFGYHRLELFDLGAAARLIVTPGRCWLPAELESGERWWGLSLQLYLLRSANDWGIGDFRTLVDLAPRLPPGCDLIGLNPLHQMFLDAPESASPYSPLHRGFLNVLYISVPDIPDFAVSGAPALIATDDFQTRIERCRATEMVDYTEVVALKVPALKLVHRAFLQTATSSRKTQFERFKEQKGSELSRTSLFQALREHFSKTGAHPPDWHSWPSCYRDPLSSQVREIANDLHDEIEFLNWAQWVADQQLEWVQDTLHRRGLRLGLYRDMAVGCDRSGAETWTAPDSFIPDTHVGAPPDILNPAGQNWGLPPLNPTTLSDNGYAAFVNLVRANMRHSGAIRIDHAMGLQRLYCIPEGGSEGAYIAYPMDDLIGMLALESQRHRCMVIGEDLGTVPEGFRARMRQAAVLSYRVFFFEFDAAGELVAPEQYPVLSLAVAGSHDMATVKSWFEETDLRLKHELKLYPSDAEYAAQVSNRARERKAVEQGIARAGLLREANPVSTVHEFLHRTRSMLRVFQLDDLLEQRDPVNIPGTAVEYPNWRRKYSAPIEEMEAAWKLLPNQPRK